VWVDKISKRFLRGSAQRERSADQSSSEVQFYDNWHAARSASDGYDSSVILERVRGSALAVKRGEAAFERDSVLFQRPAYRWQLLACVASVAASKEGRVHVVDFGGSLGSVYLQHKPFFEMWPYLMWSIVEQPTFVTCGRREFQNDRLQFFETLEETSSRSSVDLVLFSSSLQYPEAPYEAISAAIKLSPSMIIIDRMPFTLEPDDKLIIEKVPEEIFPASYPLWLLSESKMTRFLDENRFIEFARYEDGIDPEGYIGIAFKYLGTAS
jgi:putative methyltransferase (TIGR04325 family)